MNTQENAGHGEIDPLSQRVARRLRGRMAELQLRGTDVAAAIGMTQGSFSRRFTGSAAWELDELQLLESKVGISIAYLLGWEPAAEPTATGPIALQARAAEQARGPAPEDPPEQPRQAELPNLRYPDPTPIRDVVAWPGMNPRPVAAQYSASA